MKNIGYLYAIGAALTWGLVYAIDQKILTKVSPFVLIFIEAVIISIILVPIFIFDSNSIKSVITTGKTNLILILLTVVLTIGANFFIYSSIKILGASTASIFEIAYPFFIVIFTYLLFQEVVSAYFLLGAALIFSGALIIIRLG